MHPMHLQYWTHCCHVRCHVCSRTCCHASIQTELWIWSNLTNILCPTCVQSRWKEALDAGVAPPVFLACTHAKALEYVTLESLQQHALDAESAAADAQAFKLEL